MPAGNVQHAHHSWVQQFSTSDFKTLIIGDIARWTAFGRDTAPFKNFSFCPFADLNPDVLRDFMPNMVLSPLVGDNFDVIEVAACLRRLGYQGCYRAISSQVPNVAVIKADVATVAPHLDFDMLLIPPKPD